MIRHVDDARWYLRIPGKLTAFLVIVLLVEYPDPRILIRHIRHVCNLDQMIDAAAPELADLEARFKEQVAASHAGADPRSMSGQPASASAPSSASAIQRAVERFIYENVHYDWDWNIWSVADYMPTVSEMFARARQYADGRIREDCDGRAVMAASLLRRLGYESHLVTDFRHVWVQTKDRGRPVDLMGPGRTTSVISTSQGNRIDWSTLANIPVALSFGVAVFPWGREAVIFFALMTLILHRRVPRRTILVGVLLAFAGWHLLRMGVVSVGQAGEPGYRWAEAPMNAWLGLSYVITGCGVLAASSWRARRSVSRAES